VSAKEAENRVAGAAQSSGAGLPFTGLDLGLVALAGLALLLAGVAGRRGLTQSPRPNDGGPDRSGAPVGLGTSRALSP
jgi:hypothetical protein